VHWIARLHNGSHSNTVRYRVLRHRHRCCTRFWGGCTVCGHGDDVERNDTDSHEPSELAVFERGGRDREQRGRGDLPESPWVTGIRVIREPAKN
jgi:hypothetical protein